MIPIVEWALRRPRRVAATALLLAVLAVVGLTQLTTTDAVRTGVGPGAAAARAQRAVASAFGDDTISVLVPAPAINVALGEDLLHVVSLEACLNGGAPAGQAVPGGTAGPCEALRRLRPAKAVYGPGSFISAGAGALNDQLTTLAQLVSSGPKAVTAAETAARKAGRSASQVAAAGRATQREADQATSRLRQLVTTFRITSDGVTPANQTFVTRFVYGTSTAGPPKTLFRSVFPTDGAGLITVRLKPGLSASARGRIVGLVQRAAALKDFALQEGHPYVVSGPQVTAVAAAHELRTAPLALVIGGVLALVAVLLLTFRARRRLWPAATALLAALVVFGALGLLGVSATFGTLAAVPVLIGVAATSSVSWHARVEESRRRGLRGADAVHDALAPGARAVLPAAGATIAALVALLLSPTPLVRGFALCLIAGVVLAVLAASTVGLLLLGRERRAEAPSRAAVLPEAPLVPGIGTGPVVRRIVTGVHGRPRAVLAAAVVVAVAGIALSSGRRATTDLQRLVPQDLPAVRDTRALEHATGQSGEVDVLVSGRSLAAPATLAWIDGARETVLKRAGYDGAKGCTGVPVCPLTAPFQTLLGGRDASTFANDAAIEDELGNLPAYLIGAELASDRRHALLSFGIPTRSTRDQARQIERIRSAVAHPPAGVRATVTGPPVLAADASPSALRRILVLVAALVLAGAVLLVSTRSARRSVVPLVPGALAAGWSALLAWGLGLPLNPLSVALGALVVAIGTALATPLVERYRDERAGGHSDAVALARTAASTGPAVATSAVAIGLGFLVLALSGVPLLRQFGLIGALDVAVTVLALVVALPAVVGLLARRLPAPVDGL